MTNKTAKEILKIEKDKLMSEPEANRDWELISALDIAIKALEDRLQGEGLISREALKKHKIYSEERHEYVVPVYNIDNAPTVNEDILAEDVIKAHENIGYEKGFRDGYAQCITDKEEKQKGEWITTNLEEEFYDEVFKCSVCGVIDFLSNFCPNCGARMVEGGEEE